MNGKLSLIQRKLERENSARIPAPDTGIGAAIEDLIANEVERQVTEASERRPPSHTQMLLDRQFAKPEKQTTSFDQLPPVARTPAPKDRTFQFQRDELGRVSTVSVGNLQFVAQRNELGQIVRIVPSDLAPMPPVVAPAALNRAPRKLYGNDLVNDHEA